MSVPKKRKTKGKTRKGRAHHGLKPSSLAKCSNCGESKPPHQVCQVCGHYKGQPVLKMRKLEKKKEKKEKGKKAKTVEKKNGAKQKE